jgi:GNAT superfamily N-acetyltransferase
VPTELADDLEICPIGVADIPRGMELVAMAGWNQTSPDWEMMLRIGVGHGIRSRDGRLLASSVMLPFRPGIGWIGMVLVDEAVRRQGIATRLLTNAIVVARAEGLVPMLDATPAGREVYTRLGFTEMARLARWRGKGAAQPARATVATCGPAGMTAAHQADLLAFGGSRAALLAELAERPGAILMCLPDSHGYLFSRAGRTATQIGPVLAATAEDGVALCAAALDRISGPVILDVPDRETALTEFLEARGFTPERPFHRMRLDAPRPPALGAAMRVTAGPELG